MTPRRAAVLLAPVITGGLIGLMAHAAEIRGWHPSDLTPDQRLNVIKQEIEKIEQEAVDKGIAGSKQIPVGQDDLRFMYQLATGTKGDPS